MINSLRFHSLGRLKVLISSLLWRIVLLDSWLRVSSFSILCHPSLLTSMTFDEKSAVNLIEDPLYMMSHFSCAAFNILCLSFVTLIVKWLGLDLFEFALFGVCSTSWMCRFMSFDEFGEFSTVIFCHFSLSPLSVTPIMHMLVCLLVSYASFRLCLFFLTIFSFWYSHNFSSSLSQFTHFSPANLNLKLLNPHSEFFMSATVLFSSRTLFGSFYIFILIFVHSPGVFLVHYFL